MRATLRGVRTVLLRAVANRSKRTCWWKFTRLLAPALICPKHGRGAQALARGHCAAAPVAPDPVTRPVFLSRAHQDCQGTVPRVFER